MCARSRWYAAAALHGAPRAPAPAAGPAGARALPRPAPRPVPARSSTTTNCDRSGWSRRRPRRHSCRGVAHRFFEWLIHRVFASRAACGPHHLASGLAGASCGAHLQGVADMPDAMPPKAQGHVHVHVHGAACAPTSTGAPPAAATAPPVVAAVKHSVGAKRRPAPDAEHAVPQCVPAPRFPRLAPSSASFCPRRRDSLCTIKFARRRRPMPCRGRCRSGVPGTGVPSSRLLQLCLVACVRRVAAQRSMLPSEAPVLRRRAAFLQHSRQASSSTACSSERALE